MFFSELTVSVAPPGLEDLYTYIGEFVGLDPTWLGRIIHKHPNSNPQFCIWNKDCIDPQSGSPWAPPPPDTVWSVISY